MIDLTKHEEYNKWKFLISDAHFDSRFSSNPDEHAENALNSILYSIFQAGQYSLSDKVTELIQLHYKMDDEMGWKNIRTAPKDGTAILAIVHSESGDDLPVVVKWECTDKGEGWFNEYYKHSFTFTHWKPLPDYSYYAE